MTARWSAAGHCSEDDCAMHVLATVVSRPTADRAVIDAGSKALTSDLARLLPITARSWAIPRRSSPVSRRSTASSTCRSAPGARPEIGDKIRIIPNHTCVVSNLFDTMVFHRDGVVTRVEDVAARGLVW
jgi:D-serine deaminase-like pyridoxal phosphate-dependent protein